MINKAQLLDFVQKLRNNQCSIQSFLDINRRKNCPLKDDNLLFVLSGLNCGNIKAETLATLKNQGMFSDKYYNEIGETMQDGLLSLDTILNLENNTTLTPEAKQEQLEAVKILEEIKSGAMITSEDLQKLSNLTTSETSINTNATQKVKDIITEKAIASQSSNLEITTNSTSNIENITNILRPLSPSFTNEPDFVQAGKIIEDAILEGQLSLGASYQLLQNIGFNPADVSDIIKSGNTQTPNFNTNDTSANQATSSARLIEAVFILNDESNKMAYERAGDETAQSTNNSPRVAIVQNYISNNLITLEEVQSLQASGYLLLSETEMQSIETMDTHNEPTLDEKESANDEIDGMDLETFLRTVEKENEGPELQ